MRRDAMLPLAQKTDIFRVSAGAMVISLTFFQNSYQTSTISKRYCVRVFPKGPKA